MLIIHYLNLIINSNNSLEGVITIKKLLFSIVFTLSILFSYTSSNVVYAKKGDEKVFAGWILHMFISNQLKEYTPRGGMSECLKIKRKILRSQGKGGVRWECKKGKLKLRQFDAGVWIPVDHLGE
jgi:hypothetical protein